MCGCIPCASYWWFGPQPRHVPRLGIEPVILWFAGWCSVHWATTAKAVLSFSQCSIALLDNQLPYFCILCIFSIYRIKPNMDNNKWYIKNYLICVWSNLWSHSIKSPTQCIIGNIPRTTSSCLNTSRYRTPTASSFQFGTALNIRICKF